MFRTYSAIRVIQEIFEAVIGLGESLLEYASERRHGRVVMLFLRVQFPQRRVNGVRQCRIWLRGIERI